MSMAAPKPPLYLGEGEGLRPHLGFPPPQGVRPSLDGTWRAAKGGERRRTTRWALGPSEPRVSPFPLPCALGPLWEAHQPT